MTANHEALLGRAQELLEAHREDEAEAVLSAAEATAPAGSTGRQQATLGRARIALRQARWSEARARVEAVLCQNPRSADALTLRGLVEEAAGALPAARSLHERAVREDDRLGIAHYNLGRVCAALGDWGPAVLHLRRAADLEPQDVTRRYALGLALHQSGDSGGGLLEVGACLKLDPTFPAAWLTLADMLVPAGAPDVADAVLKMAAALFPGHGLAHSKRAALAVGRDDLHGARQHLHRQAEAEPTSEAPWLALAQLSLMTLDLEAAEHEARRALTLAPTSPEAHYLLGVVYDACRLRAPAEEAYRAAMSYGPSGWRPRNNLGVLLLESDQPDRWREAATLLEQAYSRCPEEDRTVPGHNLALAYAKLG